MLDDFEVKKAVKEFAGLYCIHGLRQIPRFSDNDKRRGETYESASHSFRVTALTNARERGSDVIDLQDFAGHSDPRTTLTYIRNRDRLSKSPGYVIKY